MKLSKKPWRRHVTRRRRYDQARAETGSRAFLQRRKTVARQTLCTCATSSWIVRLPLFVLTCTIGRTTFWRVGACTTAKETHSSLRHHCAFPRPPRWSRDQRPLPGDRRLVRARGRLSALPRRARLMSRGTSPRLPGAGSPSTVPSARPLFQCPAASSASGGPSACATGGARGGG